MNWYMILGSLSLIGLAFAISMGIRSKNRDRELREEFRRRFAKEAE